MRWLRTTKGNRYLRVTIATALAFSLAVTPAFTTQMNVKAAESTASSNYISLFYGDSWSSNWGQAVDVATTRCGGAFDPSNIKQGGHFYVEYSGTECEVELIMQSMSGGAGWAKITPSETGYANGHYYAKYSYENCVKAFGSSNFSGLLDKIYVGATSCSINVYSLCYDFGTGSGNSNSGNTNTGNSENTNTGDSGNTNNGDSIVAISDVIYCSPNGNGNGSSKNSPANVLSAIKSVKAGGTIYLLDGTYYFDKTIVIDESNSGRSSAMKTIAAYPGANVKWDFSALSVSDSNRGVVLDGSYWHFYGFEIAKAGDNGMLLSGDNNKIERMLFSSNQDTGLQLSRYKTSNKNISQWPSNNLILNCTSRNNCDDKTMENADGFAAKLTCGEGNVFDGCMAYNNSDDGWDLYAKSETGPIGVVKIQNCAAFRNGYTEDGRGYGDGDGNGFKLGGGGVGTAHIVNNCLAFENLNCGFTDNNNPNLASVSNCTSVNNGIGNNGKPNFSVYRCNYCDFDNLISYYNNSSIKKASDKYVGTYKNGIYYNSGSYYKVDSDISVSNGQKIGKKVSGPSDSDFTNTYAPGMGTDFHISYRNSDGSLNLNGLFETKGSYYSMGYHISSSGNSGNTDTGNSGNTDTSTSGDTDPYISVFWGNSSASNWGQAVSTLTTRNGGSFDAGRMTSDGYFYVEYSGSQYELEFILQSWSGGATWAKVSPFENGSANGHYYANFSYNDCVSAFGSKDFANLLDQIHVGAKNSSITVYSICYSYSK